jgi:hypothetical protein
MTILMTLFCVNAPFGLKSEGKGQSGRVTPVMTNEKSPSLSGCLRYIQDLMHIAVYYLLKAYFFVSKIMSQQ